MTTHVGPHDMPVGRCLVQGQHAHPDIQYERVDHPPHYQGEIEHIEYAEDRGWAQGYCLGNATKYIHRAGSKPGVDAIEDLRKAAWYINRYILWLEHGKDIWKVVRKDGS